MPSPKLAYLVTSDQVIQDTSSKKYSYINIFSSVIIPSNLDSVFLDFNISGKMLNIPEGEFSGELQLLDPKKKPFQKVNLKGNILTPGSIDLHAKFNGIQFSQTGKYIYRLLYNDVLYKNDDVYYFEVTKK